MTASKNNELQQTTKATDTTTKTVKKKRNLSDKTKKLNSIDFEYMINYIEDNAPNDKEWFIDIAFDNKHKYMHFKARNAFVDRYMPELGSHKKSKWDILKEKKWVK